MTPALRDALGFEADWVEHWSYDVGGTIAGPHGRRFGDRGDLPTTCCGGTIRWPSNNGS